MTTRIQKFAITATATLGVLAGAALPVLVVSNAHAAPGDNDNVIISGPVVLPTATPTPKIRIDLPVAPATRDVQLITATPTPKVQIVLPPKKTVTPTPTATATPKFEIANPATKTPTPTPELEIAAPATHTPTPELPIAQEPTATPTEGPQIAQREPGDGNGGGNNGGGNDGGNGSGSNVPDPDTDGDTAESADVSEEAPESAETSEQYSLEPEEERRGRGRGMEDVPGVGLVFPVARGVIGADELGLLGGALAVFGLGLGIVAYRRERPAEDEPVA